MNVSSKTSADPPSKTSANPPSSPSPVQNHDDSSRSARKQRRRINRLPNLVDQRWPHPDRRVRRRLQNPPFNTSIPPSIGVLQATSNITMANPTGIATAALSIPRSAISSDDDDDRGFRSGGNRNNNNNNAFTTLPGTITTDLDDPTLTALPDMSLKPPSPSTSPSPRGRIVSTGGSRFPFLLTPRTLTLPSRLPFAPRLPRMGPDNMAVKESGSEDGASSETSNTTSTTTTIAASAAGTAPVQPVRLWTEAQLAHAQRTHQSDAMAAEIARLNAEIRRLEAAVLALESEREHGRARVTTWVGSGRVAGRPGAGVRESWVTVDGDSDSEWESEEE